MENSRVIKFRAWDTRKGVMYESPLIRLNLCGDYSGTFGVGNPFNHTHAEIMQYTGLRDKNQAMVYEGDVVSDHVGIGVVKYSDEYAGFRVSYGNGRCKWFYDYNLRGERESIEVIGNIYENQELIVRIGEDDEQIPG